MGFALSDMRLECTAFGHHGAIPKKHTGTGEDVSPPLSWTGAPAGTKSFAVICHDPAAPRPWGFTHWTLYGLPAGTTEIRRPLQAPRC